MAAKTKKGSSAMDFIRAFLKSNRKASFAEVKAAAAKKGFNIYPISYGRAQSLEGIVKTAAYGTSKKSKARAANAGSPGIRRGPGRPRKNAGNPTLDSLEGVIRAMRESSQDQERMRRALAKIREILDDVI